MGLIIIIVLIMGIWMIASPKSALDFKIKMASKLGAKLSVTKKTYSYARYIGIALVAVCLLALLG